MKIRKINRRRSRSPKYAEPPQNRHLVVDNCEMSRRQLNAKFLVVDRLRYDRFFRVGESLA